MFFKKRFEKIQERLTSTEVRLDDVERQLKQVGLCQKQSVCKHTETEFVSDYEFGVRPLRFKEICVSCHKTVGIFKTQREVLIAKADRFKQMAAECEVKADEVMDEN